MLKLEVVGILLIQTNGALPTVAPLSTADKLIEIRVEKEAEEMSTVATPEAFVLDQQWIAHCNTSSLVKIAVCC